MSSSGSDVEQEPARDLIVLPAPETKHIAELKYTLWPASDVITLHQDDTNAVTTGSTLWLGAQASKHRGLR